ncbi:angiopoietin-related protein 1 [Nerophis lumbriciformis]|uniref:angiopoietin-related protein 1 n=1 Tax=Nerophis lumbriciformis TaxID=546530 RepID=UPI002AE0696E|nr:fibrinogen-like protein 1 [Nerophis lumbriciformis]XP_061842962.1 fibrinogen-like protein 1 [Nerophis lumbriciformis]
MTNPNLPLWGRCSALCALTVLLAAAGADHQLNATAPRNGGGAQCGEYTNQVMEDGMCRLVATLPQLDEQRCPDMFRCTDEVSYWLHENEERKQQIVALKETISELQEELRNHRHRIKVFELQHEDNGHLNTTLERRFHELEVHYAEATALMHLQGTLILNLQNQVHNLTLLVERVKRSPGCLINIVRPNPLMSSQEALHPEIQHMRSCPIDCASIHHNGVRRSGLYTVVPSLAGLPVEVYCDMDTDGGGWTVIQRRVDGSVSFDRSWREYRDGFGDLHSEFWLGNDHIHDLSTQADYSLRIDLEDWSNKHKHALYQSFSVEDEEHQYRLHVSGFSGTVQDSFGWYHDKQSFSTPDSGDICAEISHGGWWYSQCFYAHLNGVYYRGGHYTPKGRGHLGPDGIVWHSWRDSDYYSLRKVSMMIRPRSFRSHLSP